jgi:hypothetical protein
MQTAEPLDRQKPSRASETSAVVCYVALSALPGTANVEPGMQTVPRRTQTLVLVALVLVLIVLFLLAWRLGWLFGPPETVLSPGTTPVATTS